MSMVNILEKTVMGASAAAALIVALPVLGPIGVVSSAGTVISVIIGAGAATYDEFNKNSK